MLGVVEDEGAGLVQRYGTGVGGRFGRIARVETLGFKLHGKWRRLRTGLGVVNIELIQMIKK